MHRLLTALSAAMLLAACNAETSPTSPSYKISNAASADKSAGGDSKDLCKKGGYANYTRADGTAFKNQGDCVSYVEHGGALVPVAALPTITSFTGSFDLSACDAIGIPMGYLTAVFSDGTGTITLPNGDHVAVTSGASVAIGYPYSGNYTLTVTNGSSSVTSTQQPFGDGSAGTLGCVPGGVIRIPTTKGRISGGL